MKKQFVVLALSLAYHFQAIASGFGWYSAVVEWGDLRDSRDRGIKSAKDLLSENPTSEKLKLHFQILLDNELQGRFCHPSAGNGYSLNPRTTEFLSKDFIAWGVSHQRSRSVADSIFYLFQGPPRFVQLSEDKHYIKNRDLWFVIDPQSISKYLQEIRRMNDARAVPEEHRLMSRFLEGLLLIAESDRYLTQDSAEKYGLQSAIVFCGHD